MAAINQMIQKYSPEFAVNAALNDPSHTPEELTQIPMAVVGIVMKFFQIVISVSVGMAAGCIPLVGFNIGAGKKDRTAELYKLLLIFEAILLPQIVVGASKMNPLPHQMGLDGVLWSMPVSDLLTGIISAFVVVYTFRQLKK